MTDPVLHKKITVEGRVQGVFYRASTVDKARELGVKGFVLNQPDGSVYIEAEGTEQQLQSLIDWCREGPVYAQVESVNVMEGDRKNFERFEIRH